MEQWRPMDTTSALGGEHDLGRVARAQVLQARLEQPDEEVGDAIVEIA